MNQLYLAQGFEIAGKDEEFVKADITINGSKIFIKSDTVEVQKKRGVRFLQNKKSLMSGTSISVSLRAEISPLPYKKRPHLGDVLVLFFCSEWCEWYACFVEDSYLAIVEPVISCTGL